MLKLDNVSKSFDGVQALEDVRFDVAEAEVHSLIGENGAGKSTLGKIIAGVVQPDQGRISLHDREICIHNPMDAQRLGIGIIFQELDLFPNLTVAENIIIGHLTIEKGCWVNSVKMGDYCRPWLKQVGLACNPHTMLNKLPMRTALRSRNVNEQ